MIVNCNVQHVYLLPWTNADAGVCMYTHGKSGEHNDVIMALTRPDVRTSCISKYVKTVVAQRWKSDSDVSIATCFCLLGSTDPQFPHYPHFKACQSSIGINRLERNRRRITNIFPLSLRVRAPTPFYGGTTTTQSN